MKVKEVINTMHQEKIDSLIVLKPENIAYLTGFKPTTPSILILKDESTLFTSKMEMDDASAQSRAEIEELKSMGDIKKFLKGRLGIEDSMTVSTYKKLCDDFETEVTDIIESARMLKSDDEIKSIKKAIKIAESSLIDTEISGTENKVAAELEYNMRIKGSMKPAFETIVASGIRSSLPHATVSYHNLEKPVVMDWGAVCNNYCSDTTRTIIESEKHSEIFEIVLEAQEKAIKVIKPGIKASYVDKVVRDVINDYGYADSFIHSTGHGLGLEIHEKPSISKNDHSKLQNGMVITIEPGIYIKGEFGVRIEDVVLIKNRSTVLNKIKKNINF
jgi:Xaa-Pro dipeptidase